MENKSPDRGSEEQGQAMAGSLQEKERRKGNLPGSVSQEAEEGKARAGQQEPQAARKKPKPEKPRKPKKVFTTQVLVAGRTGGCEDLFLKKVSGRLSNHHIKLKRERYREDSGHFLLVFCPVVHRVSTDMQNALEHLQGEPKAVLVMLHHKPKEYNHFLGTQLQAQHPAVVRTIHTRYTLEDGLYGCQVNKEAVAAVAEVLKVHCKEMTKEPSDPAVKRPPQAQLAMPESMQRRGTPPDLASHRLERQRLKQKPLADRRGQRLEGWEPRKERKWYSWPKKDFPIQVLVTGQIGDCGNEFLQRVSDRLDNTNLKMERYREDSGHFLLVFCPVVSSVDVDMANALEGLLCEPKAILVMLHHKPKESTFSVDTRKEAQHRAVECTVHARFTLEDGFYFCQMNQEAVAIVAEVFKERRNMVNMEAGDPLGLLYVWPKKASSWASLEEQVGAEGDPRESGRSEEPSLEEALVDLPEEGAPAPMDPPPAKESGSGTGSDGMSNEDLFLSLCSKLKVVSLFPDPAAREFLRARLQEAEAFSHRLQEEERLQAQESQEVAQLKAENERLQQELREATRSQRTGNLTITLPWFKTDFHIQVRVAGKTGGCENEFLTKVSERLFNIRLKTERYQEGSGHFLLVFCPVATEVGSDMNNALEGLGSEPKAVLVMLHHKLKESTSPVDTRKQAHHPAVVRTLHARYTLESGFYACPMNEEAVAAVAKVLQDHR